MKVQDNLENYNIPSKFRLSIEQEEELARIVAEIIPELEKRRTSKVQTRKYPSGTMSVRAVSRQGCSGPQEAKRATRANIENRRFIL